MLISLVESLSWCCFGRDEEEEEEEEEGDSEIRGEGLDVNMVACCLLSPLQAIFCQDGPGSDVSICC